MRDIRRKRTLPTLPMLPSLLAALLFATASISLAILASKWLANTSFGGGDETGLSSLREDLFYFNMSILCVAGHFGARLHRSDEARVGISLSLVVLTAIVVSFLFLPVEARLSFALPAGPFRLSLAFVVLIYLMSPLIGAFGAKAKNKKEEPAGAEAAAEAAVDIGVDIGETLSSIFRHH